MDKISVIVPVYKTEKFLDRCVQSIVNQTYRNLEIILVDDGSPDNGPAMCDEWAKKDERIKVIHKINGGLSSARNAGLDSATGDYVMFADSDDYLELDMIEFLYDLIINYNADISRCSFYFDENGQCTEEIKDDSIKLPNYNELIIDLLNCTYTSGVAWNKLFKADKIKDCKYRDDDGCSEDIMFNFRFYRKNIKAVFCDLPKYHYVVRKNSIVKSEFNELAYSIVRAKKIILRSFEKNEAVYPYAVKSLVDSAFIVLSGCIKHNACPEMQKALRQDILKYKKNIFLENMFDFESKLKTLVLMLTPAIYRFVIRRNK
ncbi:MAG TPA: glycosyltransferase [Candidatus Eubacterium faecipullorum]|uniref:Glycosyltransferase n=1 Tax=Candidatus Eubacterium faecipullorum TaxID=2838571 RepID=A0A9D1RD77_9FIRM|nr:glycosyltransferase [Candidatus Eubacterium faecipullorum]